VPTHFQIDLVEGEPIQELDPDDDDTYHRQNRHIAHIIVSEDEARSGGPGTAQDETYRSEGCAVAYTDISFDPGTGSSEAVVSVSDADGCEEITISLVGYKLPDGTTGWIPDRAEEQELKDSVTLTLEPGDEVTLTIDVMDEGDASASIAAPLGLSVFGTGAVGAGIVLFGRRKDP
jgi:hypothetical protein